MLYGEKHEKNEYFKKYKEELETGGYIVRKGTDGKYTVTKKAAETSRSNDNVPIVPVGTELKYA